LPVSFDETAVVDRTTGKTFSRPFGTVQRGILSRR